MFKITNIFTNCTISPRYSSKPEWIVWHYFGALSTAKECALWFCNSENNQESADVKRGISDRSTFRREQEKVS